MPDDSKRKEVDLDAPLKALPDDPGLEKEIRNISRRVNRIMKRVEAANEAVRAIIAPETEANGSEDSISPSAKDDVNAPSK